MNTEEQERYCKFKPSIFQRIVWFFWPTSFYLKWKEANENTINR